MQVFEKMAAIWMAAILCFLAPAGLAVQRQDAMTELAVMEMAAASVEQWKQRGYITSSAYDSVLLELAMLGSYRLDLDYRQRVVEPDFQTGEYVEAYLSVPQSEVEKALEQEGIFRMYRGDILKIKIYPVSDSAGTSMLKMIFRETPAMVVQYGGIVAGELDENGIICE